MRETLTVRLSANTKKLVERAANASGITTSEYVRLAIFHQLWRDVTTDSRRKAIPRATSKGIFTDEDVYRLVS